MRCSIVILGVLIVAASHVHAREIDSLVVLQTCTDEALDSYAAQLAKQSAENGTARALPNAPACTSDDGLRARLKVGRTAFEALELDKATQLLRALLADMHAAPRFDRDRDIRLEAQSYLAWARLEQRDSAGARGYFEAICAVAPTWTLDPTQFPPNVTVQLARTCKAMKANATFRFVGTGSVGVDGKLTCTAPCDAQVSPGEHFVAFGGSEMFASAKANAVTTVTSPEPGPGDAPPDMRAAVAANDTKALAPVMMNAGADTVVVLDLTGEKTLAAVAQNPFEQTMGPLVLTRDVAADAASLQRMVVTAPVAASVSAPVWKRWWFWAGVGAVAAGATVAIIASTQGDETFRVSADVR